MIASVYCQCSHMIFINYFTVVVFSISFNTRSFNTTRFKYGLEYNFSYCAVSSPLKYSLISSSVTAIFFSAAIASATKNTFTVLSQLSYTALSKHLHLQYRMQKDNLLKNNSMTLTLPLIRLQEHRYDH